MYTCEDVFGFYNIGEDINLVKFGNGVKKEFTVIALYYF